MLYSPAQLTLKRRRDAPPLPGDHAKWVQFPRGAATVSGESPIPSRPGRPPLRPRLGAGRRGCGARSASQDTGAGPSFPSPEHSAHRISAREHAEKEPRAPAICPSVSCSRLRHSRPPDHRRCRRTCHRDGRRSVRPGAAARARRARRRLRPDGRHDVHLPRRHLPTRCGRRQPDAGCEPRSPAFRPAASTAAAATACESSLPVAPFRRRSSCRRRAPKRRSANSPRASRCSTPPTSSGARARRSSDLLRSAPGAVVVANGSRGAVASLFVRGGESNYTKVLLDGIPINEPGGTFDFGSVTTENLQRVEIVRGAQSALFGSDAMSGVVQMFTAQAPRRRTARRRDGRRAGPSAPRACRPAPPAAPAASTTRSARRASRTNNDVPNNEFDNTTLSGSAGCRRSARRDAALHRPRRARARSARRGRRPSAGPTSTPRSSATTASAASRSRRR